MNQVVGNNQKFFIAGKVLFLRYDHVFIVVAFCVILMSGKVLFSKRRTAIIKAISKVRERDKFSLQPRRRL